MFDDLCGRKGGGALAKDIKLATAENHGALYRRWLRLISRALPEIQRLHAEKMQGLREAIQQEAGEPELDGPTARLLDRLAFSAFAGCVATRLGLWTIPRAKIITAFAILHREHCQRLPQSRNSYATKVIEEVGAYLEMHRSSFRPLSTANEEHPSSLKAGYYDEDRTHGPLFLFLPAVFHDLFVEKMATKCMRYCGTRVSWRRKTAAITDTKSASYPRTATEGEGA